MIFPRGEKIEKEKCSVKKRERREGGEKNGQTAMILARAGLTGCLHRETQQAPCWEMGTGGSGVYIVWASIHSSRLEDYLHCTL